MDRRKTKLNTDRCASVIIPAYDEEATIEHVVRTAAAHRLVDDVIVVDDGSADRTAAIAKRAGARVIRFRENRGKGTALAAGVEAARHSVLVFLDADLLGLDAGMLSALIEPVLRGAYDMHTLVRERGKRGTDPTPFIPDSLIVGGERALKRALWNLVPEDERQGFDVELALNYYAKKHDLRTAALHMPGLSQVIKEKKHGLLRGFWERIAMVASCFVAYLKLHVLGFFGDMLGLERKNKF